MTRVAGFAVTLFVLAAVLGAASGEAVRAQNPKLVGSVGPEFEISLRDAQGNRVTRLEPGTYDIEVRDLADFHSFHLEGPGVDERTQVEFTGTLQWTVTFRDGNYEVHCDPHPDLAQRFVVGNPPATQPSPAPGAVTPRTRLVLTSGPAEVITLKTPAGAAVKTMRLGTYTLTVRDRGRDHNAHLRAPGVNRKTTVLFRGTVTWKVALKRAGRFQFLCDPHALTGMKGSARIVR